MEKCQMQDEVLIEVNFPVHGTHYTRNVYIFTLSKDNWQQLFVKVRKFLTLLGLNENLGRT